MFYGNDRENMKKEIKLLLAILLVALVGSQLITYVFNHYGFYESLGISAIVLYLLYYLIFKQLIKPQKPRV